MPASDIFMQRFPKIIIIITSYDRQLHTAPSACSYVGVTIYQKYICGLQEQLNEVTLVASTVAGMAAWSMSVSSCLRNSIIHSIFARGGP